LRFNGQETHKTDTETAPETRGEERLAEKGQLWMGTY